MKKKKDPRIERLKAILAAYEKPVDFFYSLIDDDGTIQHDPRFAEWMKDIDRMKIEEMVKTAGVVSVFIPYYQMIDGRIIERKPYIKDRGFLAWVKENEMQISNPVSLEIVKVDILANIDFRTGIGGAVQSRVQYAGDFIVGTGAGNYRVKLPVHLTQEIFPFDKRNIHQIP